MLNDFQKKAVTVKITGYILVILVFTSAVVGVVLLVLGGSRWGTWKECWMLRSTWPLPLSPVPCTFLR